MTREPDNRLWRLLADLSGHSPELITPDMSLRDLGVDSLDRVILAVQFEHAFQTEIPDAMLTRVSTVADLTALIPLPRNAA